MYFQNKISRLALLVLTTTFILSCSSDNNETIVNDSLRPMEVITDQGVSVPVFDYQGLTPLFESYNDTLYIYNFWATWCKPCVEELPYFNLADSVYSGKPVRIVLISLDFTENVKSQLIPFMIENNIQAEVIVLDDMDSNRWIPLVDPSWEGVIPATLFKKRNARKFQVGSYTYDELTDEIDEFLNN